MAETETPKKKLSTTTKALIGVGVVAAGVIGYKVLTKEAHASEAKGGEPTPGGDGGGTPGGGTTPPVPDTGIVEPIYGFAPGFGVNAPLPLIGPTMKWWAFGGPSAPFTEFLTSLGTRLASQDSTPASMPRAIESDSVLSDASTLAANPAQGFGPGQNAPSSAWIAYVGPDQRDMSVSLAREYIAQLRKAVGKAPIIWVLSYSTPPALAKALAVAGEQWVRVRSDDPVQAADDALVMLTRGSLQEISDELAKAPWATPTAPAAEPTALPLRR